MSRAIQWTVIIGSLVFALLFVRFEWSLDALDPDRHDGFRKVRGAWQNTVEGAEILNRTGLPFIVQTTAGSHNLGELEAIADFAHDRLAAKVWNLSFISQAHLDTIVREAQAMVDSALQSLDPSR